MDGVLSRRTPATLLRVTLVLALLGLVAAPAMAGALVIPKSVDLVSYGPDGTTSESGCSHSPDVSYDGRYVVFETSNPLVPEDVDDWIQDVYRRDVTTGETRLVSYAGEGSWNSGTGARDAKISDDGRFVSFFTGWAFDEADTNGDVDIYVWDATDDSYTWVDLRGIYASNGNDLGYELSGDGSTIVLQTGDSMVPGDTSSGDDVYAIDVATGSIAWVSGDALDYGSYGSREPAVSDDGRFVAFISGKVFTADDDNGGGSASSVDVYIRDLDAPTPTFTLVPFRDHMEGPGYAIEELDLSGDGTTVVIEARGRYGDDGFSVPDDQYSNKDIYSYDLSTDTFTWVSGYPLDYDDYGSRDAEISDDGGIITFYTGKSFVEEDGDSQPEVCAYDTASGEYALLNSWTSMQYDSAEDFAMSGDASTVVWESGSDLVVDDRNGSCDIYMLGMPSPVDDVYSMDEDTVLADSVVVNDGLFTQYVPPIGPVDFEAAKIDEYEVPSAIDYSVALVDDVTSGSLQLYSSGVFVYTPDKDFNGVDTFTYSVTDEMGTWPGIGTVTITVNPVADAPVAAADSYSTPKNTALSGTSVLANDSDADGDSLTATLVSTVSNGSLSLNADGTFLYTPAAGFMGVDSFSYTANDGTTASAAATVSIAVFDSGAPVYRFFNVKTGTHFYTTSAAEKATVESKLAKTYKYEGVAYTVYKGLDNAPLYRFYNKVNGAHLYTADEHEKAIIQSLWSKTFTYEGVSYYVSTSGGSGKAPVFRFVNMRNSAHFYTASAAERDAVMANMSTIYHYEGIAFFVTAP